MSYLFPTAKFHVLRKSIPKAGSLSNVYYLLAVNPVRFEFFNRHIGILFFEESPSSHLQKNGVSASCVQYNIHPFFIFW